MPIDLKAMERFFNQAMAETSEKEYARAEIRLGPGDNQIRLFPPPDDMDMPFIETHVHWNVGPDRKKRLFCLKTWGDPCPVCQRVSQLYESQDKADQDYAKRLRASVKYVLLAINRAKEEEGVGILLAAKTIWQGIMADYLRKPDPIILHDPVNGFDINVKRQVENGITKYVVIREPDRAPITDPEQLEIWKKNAPHPVEWLNSQRKTYEEAVAIVQGRKPFRKSAPTNTVPQEPQSVVENTPPLPTGDLEKASEEVEESPKANDFSARAKEIEERLKKELAGSV